MSTLRCAQCGLVNFSTATQCKRCRTPFVQNLSSVAGTKVQGIVLEDGYVLPPPPSAEATGAGVWRGKSKMVLSKGTPLPDRCVQCNGPADGHKLKKKFSWHHPIFYVLIFTGLLIYFIVAMFVRKSVTVELGLCEDRMAKRRRNVLVTVGLIVLGVFAFPMTAVTGENYVMVAGMLLIIAGIIYGIIALRIVTPARIDNKFAWLKGVNKDYLNLLPQWRRGQSAVKDGQPVPQWLTAE